MIARSCRDLFDNCAALEKELKFNFYLFLIGCRCDCAVVFVVYRHRMNIRKIAFNA